MFLYLTLPSHSRGFAQKLHWNGQPLEDTIGISPLNFSRGTLSQSGLGRSLRGRASPCMIPFGVLVVSWENVFSASPLITMSQCLSVSSGQTVACTPPAMIKKPCFFSLSISLYACGANGVNGMDMPMMSGL